MASTKILVLLVSIFYRVLSQGQPCLDCDHLDRPEDCIHQRDCPHDEFCATEVREEGHEHYKWKFHCKKQHDCHDHVMMGRRQHDAHHPHPDHHNIRCDQCCDGRHSHLCNRYLCASFATRTTSSTQATTVATTAQTVTTTQKTSPQKAVYDANCTDHEEDGIKCSQFDKTTLCYSTDVTSIMYTVAHQKCPLYCGFCTSIKPTTPSQTGTTLASLFTATSSCHNIELNGIDCRRLAKDENICTDPVLDYLKTKHCKKTCGLC